MPLQVRELGPYMKALHTRTTAGTFRKLHATRVFERVLNDEAAKATSDAELVEAFNATQESARAYLNHQSLDIIFYYIHKRVVADFCRRYGFRLRQLLTVPQINLNWLRASDDATKKQVFAVSSTDLLIDLLERCSSPPPTVDAPQSIKIAPLTAGEVCVRYVAHDIDTLKCHLAGATINRIAARTNRDAESEN